MLKRFLDPTLDFMDSSFQLRTVWCRPMYSCCAIHYMVKKSTQWRGDRVARRMTRKFGVILFSMLVAETYQWLAAAAKLRGLEGGKY